MTLGIRNYSAVCSIIPLPLLVLVMDQGLMNSSESTATPAALQRDVGSPKANRVNCTIIR